MKKYPKYKNTNIEWLEQIPEHWEISKIKDFAKVLTGATPKTAVEEYWNGNINWVTTDDLGKLKDKYIIKTRRRISQLGYDNSGVKLAEKKSIVLSTRAPIGHLGILDIEACSNQGCKTIEANSNYSSEFVYYVLSISKDYLRAIGVGTTFIELTTLALKTYLIPLPPLSEQKAIADYLDKKTNEIDQIIEAKKKLIALYNEEKSALINKAVTKGIDDKAKLKPSGVEWLGDIPQHWEVKKLNRIADITLGKTLSSKKKGDMTEEYYLRSANIDWYKPRLDSIKKMWFTPHEKSKMKVEKYDLIVSEGGDVGRTCIWNDEIENCYIQNSVHRVRFENRIEALYYLNLFVLYGKLGVYDSVVNRISIAHLTVDKISSLVFPFPPLKEQEKIVDYIEKNVSVIDKKIANAKRLIELMSEYRTTLISEVVTGKVKVV